MKTIKYLNIDEAVWYTGMSSHSIEREAKNGNIRTVGKRSKRHYRLKDLNRLKDILAMESGEPTFGHRVSITFSKVE